jgi:hypothetical protein
MFTEVETYNRKGITNQKNDSWIQQQIVQLHHSWPRYEIEVSSQPHAPIALYPGKERSVTII